MAIGSGNDFIYMTPKALSMRQIGFYENQKLIYIKVQNQQSKRATHILSDKD